MATRMATLKASRINLNFFRPSRKFESVHQAENTSDVDAQERRYTKPTVIGCFFAGCVVNRVLGH